MCTTSRRAAFSRAAALKFKRPRAHIVYNNNNTLTTLQKQRVAHVRSRRGIFHTRVRNIYNINTHYASLKAHLKRAVSHLTWRNIFSSLLFSSSSGARMQRGGVATELGRNDT